VWWALKGHRARFHHRVPGAAADPGQLIYNGFFQHHHPDRESFVAAIYVAMKPAACRGLAILAERRQSRGAAGS